MTTALTSAQTRFLRGQAHGLKAMLQIGDSGSCIQLLAPLTPESTIGKFLDKSGPGIQQMAYRVEDIDAVSATLMDRTARPESAKRARARYERSMRALRAASLTTDLPIGSPDPPPGNDTRRRPIH